MQNEIAALEAQLQNYNTAGPKYGALSDDEEQQEEEEEKEEEEVDDKQSESPHENKKQNEVDDEDHLDTIPDSTEADYVTKGSQSESRMDESQSDEDMFDGIPSPRSPTPPPSQNAIVNTSMRSRIQAEETQLLNKDMNQISGEQTELPAEENDPPAQLDMRTEEEMPEELRKALSVLQKYQTLSPSLKLPLSLNSPASSKVLKAVGKRKTGQGQTQSLLSTPQVSAVGNRKTGYGQIQNSLSAEVSAVGRREKQVKARHRVH